MKKLFFIIFLFVFTTFPNIINASGLTLEMTHSINEGFVNLNLKEPQEFERDDILSVTLDFILSDNIRYVGPKGSLNGYNLKDNEDKLSILALGLDDIDIFKDSGITLKFKIDDIGGITIEPFGKILTTDTEQSININFDPGLVAIGEDYEGAEKIKVAPKVPSQNTQVLTQEPQLGVPAPEIEPQEEEEQEKKSGPLPDSGLPTYILLIFAVLIFMIYRFVFSNE